MVTSIPETACCKYWKNHWISAWYSDSRLE